MGCWFFKQPNGKYGRFSTVVDTVTHCNLSKRKLKKWMIDNWGKNDYDVINFDRFLKGHGQACLYPFENVLNDMTNMNEDTLSARQILIKMGVPKEEAEKYYFLPEPDEGDEEGWENYDCGLQKN